MELTLQKYQLLDLFCGAGGAAIGYHRAGFTDIVGVDIADQPRYPFRFVQDDALAYLRWLIGTGEIERFDLIHASPPCQAYSITKSIHGNDDHPELVTATRRLLRAIGKPYVIENVPGAPLVNPLMLCGTMFPDLRVQRHRLFECSPPIWFPPAVCNHWATLPPSKRHYHTLEKYDMITCVGHNFSAESGRIAMGTPWMTRDEIAQAIPPAYTEYIGQQLLELL